MGPLHEIDAGVVHGFRTDTTANGDIGEPKVTVEQSYHTKGTLAILKDS